MVITKDCKQRITLDSQREYTSEGYLKVPARFSRCGIYQYRASELDIKSVPPETVLNVYRPKEEVFDKESLKSFYGAVVTDDHPPEMVDANNFKNYELGTVMSEGREDGEYVQGDLLIRDAKAIKKIEEGKEEISAGYKAVYDYQIVNGQVVAGNYTVDDGVVKKATCEYGSFDVIQRGVRVNHVAIVSAGRAGQEVRVFDNDINEGQYMPQITLDSGASVEIKSDNANVIAQEFKAKDSKIAAMQKDHKAEMKDAKESYNQALKKKDDEIKDKESALEKTQAELDAEKEENEKMKKKTSDEAIMQRVKEISLVSNQCKKIAGEDVALDTANIIEMKRKALKATNDAINWDDKSDMYCEARFDIAIETAETKIADQSVYDRQIETLTADPQSVNTSDSEIVKSRRQQYVEMMKEGA